MLIILGVLLLTLNSYELIKGNIANEILIDLHSYNNSGYISPDSDPSELLRRIVFYFTLSLAYLVGFNIFLISLLIMGIHMIPSLILLVLIWSSFFFTYFRNKNENFEETVTRLSKNRTLKGTLGSLVYCIFLIYILIQLVI